MRAFTSQLLRLAQPHSRRFAIIASLALLATCFDLFEPLIYRFAVNDIAGLFVEGGEVAESRREAAEANEPDDTPQANEANEAKEPSDPGDVVAGAAEEAVPRGEAIVSPRTVNQALETLLWGVALLFLIRVTGHGLQLAAEQRTAALGSRIESDVINQAFRHVVRLPLGFFTRRSTGALVKQIDQLDQVSPIVRAAVHELLPELLRVIGALAIMFTQSWRLSLVALLLLPPYVWIVRRSVSQLETGLDGYYGLWERVSARIQGVLGAIKTVKLAGAEEREAEQLHAQCSEAYDRYLQRNRLANRYLFWQTTVNYAGQALVLGFGGLLVLRRQLTPGDVVMFVAYLEKLFGPVETLSASAVTLQEHLASLRRALRLMATGSSEPRGEALPRGRGEVRFENVQFAYDPAQPVLRGLTFTAPAGHVTAIVGRSGAGKTTAMDLLLRLYEPNGGIIRLDGHDIATLDPPALRASIGVVAADGTLFRGSLADNIRYKQVTATLDEVREAALSAGLEPLLQRLPEGLETEIGDGGVGLSVGERQRLQLARVLVSRPRVLVLDEATANLDYSTEQQIRAILFERPACPTTLVIAHRYSMVKSADHVVVIDEGRVVAEGSPQAVRRSNPWFAQFAATSAAASEAGS